MRSIPSIGHSFIVILAILSLPLSCGDQRNGSNTNDGISNVSLYEVKPVQKLDRVQEIPVENCYGTSENTRRLGMEQIQKRSIDIGRRAITTAGVEIEVPDLVRAKLEGQVIKEYREAFESARAIIDNFEMKAKPGTHVIYLIKWNKHIYKSEISFSYKREKLKIPYEYILYVPDYEGTRRIKCPEESSDFDHVAMVEIVPNTVTVAINDSHKLSVNLKDRNGNPLHGRKIKWSSSNDSIATVGQDGKLTGRSVGEVAIKAESEGVVGSAKINVEQPQIASIDVIPNNIIIKTGQTKLLSYSLKDRNGFPIKNRRVRWKSADKDIISLSDGGMIVGLSTGAAVVTANADERKGIAQVNVAWGITELRIEELSLILNMLPEQIQKGPIGVLLPLTGNFAASGSMLKKKIDKNLSKYRITYQDASDSVHEAQIAMTKLAHKEQCKLIIFGPLTMYKKLAEKTLSNKRILAYFITE